MDNFYTEKLDNCHEDYKKHRGQGLAYSIFVNIIILIVATALCFLWKNWLVKVVVILISIILILLSIGIFNYFSPQTTFRTIDYNGEALTGYVTNDGDVSYLNLHYKGTKYYKKFKRIEFKSVSSEDVPESAFYDMFAEIISLLFVNSAKLIGNVFNNKLKLVQFEQNIEGQSITVIYNVKKNRIGFILPTDNKTNKKEVS